MTLSPFREKMLPGTQVLLAICIDQIMGQQKNNCRINQSGAKSPILNYHVSRHGGMKEGTLQPKKKYCHSLGKFSYQVCMYS